MHTVQSNSFADGYPIKSCFTEERKGLEEHFSIDTDCCYQGTIEGAKKIMSARTVCFFPTNYLALINVASVQGCTGSCILDAMDQL